MTKSPKGPKVPRGPKGPEHHHGLKHKIIHYIKKPIRSLNEIILVSNKVYYALFALYIIIGCLAIVKIKEYKEKYDKDLEKNPLTASNSDFIISIIMFFLYISVAACYFVLGHETNHH